MGIYQESFGLQEYPEELIERMHPVPDASLRHHRAVSERCGNRGAGTACAGGCRKNPSDDCNCMGALI